LTNFLHQRKRSEASLSDEYETPDFIIAELSKQYGIFPTLDVACRMDKNNRKCQSGIHVDLENDALDTEWNHTNFSKEYPDVWCNPPQTKCKEFVLKANEQNIKHNINIMMIIPANVLTTNYFAEVIQNVEYHPIKGRITFLVDGKPSPYPARNGYFVVIWRKK